MSNIKELATAIILGKDYSQAFDAVMAEKAYAIIEKHKKAVAETMFESAECCTCQKSMKQAGSNKCSVCDMPIRMAKNPKGTPEEKWKVSSNKTKDVMEEFGLEESEMTPEQMKNKEEIVMGLKKQIPYLKKKYGDRWKEVMYRIATSAAMKNESIEGEDIAILEKKFYLDDEETETTSSGLPTSKRKEMLRKLLAKGIDLKAKEELDKLRNQ